MDQNERLKRIDATLYDIARLEKERVKENNVIKRLINNSCNIIETEMRLIKASLKELR